MLCMVLKNVVLALRQIHVRGDEAETLANAIKNLETLIKIIDNKPDQNKKEAGKDDHHDEPRAQI